MSKCVICGNANVNIIFYNFPGYVEGTFFDIFSCNNCDSQFINADDSVKSIYNIIYSFRNTPGYERYYKYAQAVKNLKEPLKYLAYNESTYYPVYEFVKNRSNLKILEIGCGYGYLSYSLKQMGFNIKAIDIAESAISFAKKNYGDYYIQADIKDYLISTKEKYDLIISTEVIEHLNDPNGFLEDCKKLLNNRGTILLTTPDKDFYPQNSIWKTDLPPVHISWIGRKGFNFFAERHSLAIEYQDFSNYYSSNENKIIKFFLSRRKKIVKSVITKDGIAIKKIENSKTHKILAKILHKNSLIRGVCNYLFNLINGKEVTLGVFLSLSKVDN